MQILNAEEIRAWDEFTMKHEPIASIDLMERAAAACFEWLRNKGYSERSFTIFCGKGNNGGDGLALARMLIENDAAVKMYILEFGHKGTDDFQTNLARLHERKADIHFIQTAENIHPIPAGDIVIDALYGSGLNRPLEGVTAELVQHINHAGNEIISIDIPSGMFLSKSSKNCPVITATHTLSFQCYRLSFLVAENSKSVGEITILDIGLHPGYIQTIRQSLLLVDRSFIKSIFKARDKFANKGNFGHALLLAGSYGKMGAAVLAAKACLRSGAGLLTTHVPLCGYEIMQTSLPEAMVSVDSDEKINTSFSKDAFSKYTTLGIGPGIGTDQQTGKLVRFILEAYKKPFVVDADALNILGENKALLKELAPYSILTPHPKEFERLFGEEENDFARIASAQKNAATYTCTIILKGHYTFIALPDGTGYFNTTGNAGMAKGGSGDVLMGMVTAFLAQGYLPAHAAIIAVYLHGLAGDLAAGYFSQQSMLASDIIGCIGQAVLSVQ